LTAIFGEPESLLNMRENVLIPKRLSELDWRLFLALSLTFFWLGSGAYYLTAHIGWDEFSKQPLDTLGSFLEGAFAPLAFLWLVVGFFLQQKELSKNNEAMHQQHIEMQKSAQHAAIQTSSIQISVQHSQQQSFIRMYEMVRVTLGSVVGMLYISSQGPRGVGLIDSDKMSKLWSEMVNGDAEMFSRRFLLLSATDKEDMYDLLYGTEIRARHSNNFVRQYARLIDGAKKCDPEGMLTDAICDSAHGRLYEIMLEINDAAYSPQKS
jgi:hypothetical protein